MAFVDGGEEMGDEGRNVPVSCYAVWTCHLESKERRDSENHPRQTTTQLALLLYPRAPEAVDIQRVPSYVLSRPKK